MNEETVTNVSEISDPELTMEIVMKKIYTSCDPEETNRARISAVIEFIRPYMQKDLSALETLKAMLESDGTNGFVESEHFYTVMNEWTQKISSQEDNSGEFGPASSNLMDFDDSLPYTQSTPRPSFGQKLLSSQDLLNLSNVSHYNCSPTKQIKDHSIGGHEKSLLEEKLKQSQYEFAKVLDEMNMLRAQLALLEEQNEYLHNELDRFKTRSQSEHQINGHLQDHKTYQDDLNEEDTVGKQRIEELNKKLNFFEKENAHLNRYVQKLEKENSEFEDRYHHMHKLEQCMKDQLNDIKAELDIKEHELASERKISEGLMNKLYETRSEVDQLLNENELLDHKKQGLERILTSGRYSLSSHYICLDEMNTFFIKGTIPIYSSPPSKRHRSANNSSFLLNNSLNPLSSYAPVEPPPSASSPARNATPARPGVGLKKSFSLNAMSTRSMPNIFCTERGRPTTAHQDSPNLKFTNGPYESLQMELFQVDPQYQFDYKSKNGIDIEYEDDLSQTKDLTLEEDSKVAVEPNSNSDIVALNEQIEHLTLDKRALETYISNLKEENKTETNRIVRDLEDRLSSLNDECDRLRSEIDVKNKEIIDVRNKFDFESAFKKLEIDYNKKCNLLEEIRQFRENDKNVIAKLSGKIKELEGDLKDKERFFIDNNLHSNIERTANAVQSHIDEKKSFTSELRKHNIEFKYKISNLENDLNDKMKQVEHLKEIIRKDEIAKNKLQKHNQELEVELDIFTNDYKKLLKDVSEQENLKKELKEEYNNLLSKFNQEVELNHQLAAQLSSKTHSLNDSNEKYDRLSEQYSEQSKKYSKVLEELSQLKNETEKIREYHKSFKEELNKSLSDYQKSLQFLSLKVKELEVKTIKLETDWCNFHEFDSIESDDKKEDSSTESSLMTYTYSKSSCPKSASYEKQKLTIDRLKEKLNNLEETLLKERGKNRALAHRLTAAEEGLREGKISIGLEKNALQFAVDDLRDKLAQRDMLRDAAEKKIEELSFKLSQSDQTLNGALISLAQKEQFLKGGFEAQERLSRRVRDLQAQLKELKAKGIDSMNRASDDDKLAKDLSSVKSHKGTNCTLSSFVTDENGCPSKDHVDGVTVNGNEKDSNVGKMAGLLDVVVEYCSELNALFTKFVVHWKSVIEMDPICANLPSLKLCNSLELEDILPAIVHNFKAIISLFNNLILKSPSTMQDDADSYLNYLSHPKVASNDPKTIRKFTLTSSNPKAKTTVQTPDNRDQESRDVGQSNCDTECTNTEGGEHSPVRATCDFSNIQLPILNFDLQLQGVFPHVSENFLKQSGLHDSSPKKKMSKDETETLFTTFAIQLGLESKDIKERLNKQKELCSNIHRKFSCLLRDVSVRLRDHKCIGAVDSINPVYLLLEDLRYQMNDMSQAVGQLGALTCECHMTKCWNLVTNYMATVRQEVEYWKEQSSSSRLLTGEATGITNLTETEENTFEKCPSCEKPRLSAECNMQIKKRSKFRSCLSIFSSAFVWMSYFSFLLFMGIIYVHWRCKVNTELKICPLDDFVNVFSQSAGCPPY